MSSWKRILALASVLAIAAGFLRFYHLGAWPFFGDELATFNEARYLGKPADESESSQVGRIWRVIPLSYVVHNAGYALFGKDEFGSRAILAILGTIQVVIVFVGLTPPLGIASAFMAAMLLALWPEHIYQCQEHRFYLTASFFTTLCMVAGAWSVYKRSLGALVLACLLGFAAILCHTLEGVVFAGLMGGVFLAAWAAREGIPWKSLAVIGTALLLAGGLLKYYLLPQIQGWNSGQGWGVGAGHSLLASLYELGWPIALLVGLGVLCVVYERDPQGWYWLAWAGLWIGSSVVFPFVVVYHSAYVFPLALGAIVVASIAAGRLFSLLRRQSPSLALGWLGVIAALNLPSLLSHYSDGSRHDYRAAAHYIEKHWQQGDHIAAVAPGALRHYSTMCQEAVSLNTWNALPNLKELSQTPQRLWIVIPSNRSGKSEELRRWLGTHCTQELEIRPPRFDYREYIVEVYLLRPQFVADSR